MSELEALLEEQLRRSRQRGAVRYMVTHEGELWAVRDCEQEPQSGGKVVRLYRSKYIAQSAALFGNTMGPCECCARPATVLVYGRACCVDCLPAHEEWGLIPLHVLRTWAQANLR